MLQGPDPDWPFFSVTVRRKGLGHQLHPGTKGPTAILPAILPAHAACLPLQVIYSYIFGVVLLHDSVSWLAVLGSSLIAGVRTGFICL